MHAQYGGHWIPCKTYKLVGKAYSDVAFCGKSNHIKVIVRLTFAMKLAPSRFQVIFTHSWHWWRYKGAFRVGTRIGRLGLGHSVFKFRVTIPASPTLM